MSPYRRRSDVLEDMMEFFSEQENQDIEQMRSLLRESFFIFRVQEAREEIEELNGPLREPGKYLTEVEIQQYKDGVQDVMDTYMLTHDMVMAFGYVNVDTQIVKDNWPS